MIKKLSLTVLTISTLVLSGCGSSSSSKEKSITERISDKNYIVILKGIASGICESTEYKDALKTNFKELLTSEEPTTVTCATYGHTSKTCDEGTYEGASNKGDVACVIGFNKYIEKTTQKLSQSIDLSVALDTIQSSYIDIAE